MSELETEASAVVAAGELDLAKYVQPLAPAVAADVKVIGNDVKMISADFKTLIANRANDVILAGIVILSFWLGHKF